MQQINVGLLGFGLAGKTLHSPFLKYHEGFTVKKVMTSRAQEVVEVFPDAIAVSNIEEITNDPEIDLVINCGPNIHHYDHSLLALNSGKHLVVEKPFVNTVVEGEKLIAAANKNKRVLTVFHNRRWDSDFLTIKSKIKSGEWGEVKLFESHFDRFKPESSSNWREIKSPGAGVFFDLGPHLIDQALLLFGKPESLLADIVEQRGDGGVDDYFHLIMKYKEKRVILHAGCFSNQSPRFHIQCTNGIYKKFGFDIQEKQLKAEVVVNDVCFGVEDESTYGMWYPRGDKTGVSVKSEDGNYFQFYNTLYKAIVEGGPNPVEAEAALEVIRVIETAFESHTKQCWVRFSQS